MNSYYHIKKIAVATDFSEESLNAVNRAMQLADIFQTSLDMIHAISPSASRNKKAEFVSAAYLQLKEIRQQVERDCSVETAIYARVGAVEDFIYNYCVKNGIDLLVIGIKAGNRKLFGESKAYQIIMKVECPVLSIPIKIRHLCFKKILFPVRGVTGVREKLLYSLPYMDKMGALLQIMIFGLPNAEQIRAVTLLANDKGILFDPPDWDQLNEKDISAQVLHCAEKVKANLIVINATSEKEWYKPLEGNYTEFLLRESGLPLLSITHQYESVK